MTNGEMMADEGRKQPQSEPEIIPPGQQPDSGVWVSETMRGTQRIYTPFTSQPENPLD
jgi:hypothetical protein